MGLLRHVRATAEEEDEEQALQRNVASRDVA